MDIGPVSKLDLNLRISQIAECYSIFTLEMFIITHNISAYRDYATGSVKPAESFGSRDFNR